MAGFTVESLIKFLEQFPKETVVGYRDMRWGGMSDQLEEFEIEYDGKRVLIDSQLWEELD